MLGAGVIVGWPAVVVAPAFVVVPGAAVDVTWLVEVGLKGVPVALGVPLGV